MPDFDPRFDLLNPFTLARFTWLQGRRGWSRLWQAPGPNARFFVGTTYFWAVAMAFTDPYKALYLSKLGLSNLAIGGFFALDMGLRIFGVLLGGLFAQRWGHKRTLIIFDTVSWVIPSACLALATEPWHVYVATCLISTNAMVAGSVTQLLVEDTPEDKRGMVFALFSLTFVVPMVLLPALAGWGIDHWGVVPVMRCLFGLCALLTGSGILWRRVRLKESAAVSHGADLPQLLREAGEVAQALLRLPILAPVLGSWVVLNMLANLNKAYYALYVTQHWGLPDGWVGLLTTASALAFVAASLAWVPRLRPGREGAQFAWLSAANALPALALFLGWGPWWVLGLAVAGGLLSAPLNALMSEQLARLLPPGKEGLAQSLLSCAMQAAVALSLALAGALFESRFNAYPAVMGGLALAQGWMAWRARKIP